MCRNIKPLYNFEPPATDDEINAAAIQFVRKVSGYNKPSAINQTAFDTAVAEVAAASKKMLEALITTASPKDREAEQAKAVKRREIRFGTTENI